MTDRPTASVVVPLWAGGHDLEQLLPALPASLGDVHEVIVAAGPRSQSLRRLATRLGARFVSADGDGYGQLLGAALAQAGGEYVITVDADFPESAGPLAALWRRRDEGELVIGSRYAPGASVEMRWGRRLTSRALNAVYRRALALPVRDLSSGLRLWRRDALQDVLPVEAAGLDALLEMAVKAFCQGWRVVDVPVIYRQTRPWSRARAVRHVLGFIRTLGKLFALRNSMRAADYDSRAFDSWIPLQRRWHRQRLRVIRQLVGDAGRILDAGCGSSRIVQSLPRAVGVDLVMGKLRWLRTPGRRLVRADLNRLPFRDGVFDAVISAEVIEHIPRDQIRLSELVRVIAPGGILVVGTPDYGKWTWRALEWVYRLFPGGYGDEHVNRYTYTDLREALEDDLGLDILECRYVGRADMIFKARRPSPAAMPQAG